MKNQSSLYSVCGEFSQVSLAGIYDYTCSTVGTTDDETEGENSSIGKRISDGVFDMFHISQIGDSPKTLLTPSGITFIGAVR